jgi:hypothetical protein
MKNSGKLLVSKEVDASIGNLQLPTAKIMEGVYFVRLKDAKGVQSLKLSISH